MGPITYFLRFIFFTTEITKSLTHIVFKKNSPTRSEPKGFTPKKKIIIIKCSSFYFPQLDRRNRNTLFWNPPPAIGGSYSLPTTGLVPFSFCLTIDWYLTTMKLKTLLYVYSRKQKPLPLLCSISRYIVFTWKECWRFEWIRELFNFHSDLLKLYSRYGVEFMELDCTAFQLGIFITFSTVISSPLDNIFTYPRTWQIML